MYVIAENQCKMHLCDMKHLGKARVFLLVDLREFFSDLESWGRKNINKKALKMTS